MKNQTLTKDVQEAKLMDANISKTEAETDKVKAETKKLAGDMDVRLAEMRKMNAEAALIHKKTAWYPLVLGSAVGTGATLAGMTLIRYIGS